MLSLLSAFRLTILPSQLQVIFTESEKKGVTKLYNFTAIKKKGVTKLFPWNLTFPICLEHLLKGSRTLAPIMHIYGKEKRLTIPKGFFEKKAYQCMKTDEVTRIDGTEYC
jgi:hypothetical protein